jgi:hypothetical protein
VQRLRRHDAPRLDRTAKENAMKRTHHFHHIVVATCALLTVAALPSPGLAQKPPREGPAHPYHPSRALVEKTSRTPPGGIVPVGLTPKPPHVERGVAERGRLAPQTGPGPRRAGTGTHGIIFVGGHTGIDHSSHALNPQPIPPGHSLRHLPPPGSPVEASGH